MNNITQGGYGKGELVIIFGNPGGGKIECSDCGGSGNEECDKCDSTGYIKHGDYYIPDEIDNKILDCLNTNDKQIKHRMGDVIYTITGRYVVDGDFEMFWDSSESFAVNIAFKIKSVFEDNLGNNTHRIIKDRDEMIELVYTVSSDDSYLFESPIYECFSESVSEYITFLDTEWQYCDIHIIAI